MDMLTDMREREREREREKKTDRERGGFPYVGIEFSFAMRSNYEFLLNPISLAAQCEAKRFLCQEI